MKILDLILQCNKDNVIYAYEQLFPFDEYNPRTTEKLNGLFKRNAYLTFVLNDIKKQSASFISKETNSKNIVYIIETQSTNLEDKKTDYFVLHIEKPTTQFDISKICNMGLSLSNDIEKNKELYNTEVSKMSIDNYGIDICCAVLLHELILFGYGKENIEKMYEYFYSQIKKGEEDIEKGNYLTEEEVEKHIEELRQQIYEEANEYEKLIIEANNLKDEHIKDIKTKYRKEKNLENIKMIENFVNETINQKETNKIDELCAMLNNRQYREETTKEIEKFAKENNLIICFGASDDLLELRGLIDDEFDAYDGTTIYINPQTKKVEVEETNETPYYIELKWGETKDCSWTFDTNLKHKTFNILEDEDLYCIGIVCEIK